MPSWPAPRLGDQRQRFGAARARAVGDPVVLAASRSSAAWLPTRRWPCRRQLAEIEARVIAPARPSRLRGAPVLRIASRRVTAALGFAAVADGGVCLNVAWTRRVQTSTTRSRAVCEPAGGGGHGSACSEPRVSAPGRSRNGVADGCDARPVSAATAARRSQRDSRHGLPRRASVRQLVRLGCGRQHGCVLSNRGLVAPWTQRPATGLGGALRASLPQTSAWRAERWAAAPPCARPSAQPASRHPAEARRHAAAAR